MRPRVAAHHVPDLESLALRRDKLISELCFFGAARRDGRDYPGHFYSTRNGAKSIVMDLFWQGKQEWE